MGYGDVIDAFVGYPRRRKQEPFSGTEYERSRGMLYYNIR
jgi:hypothetical protein